MKFPIHIHIHIHRFSVDIHEYNKTIKMLYKNHRCSHHIQDVLSRYETNVVFLFNSLISGIVTTYSSQVSM